MKRIIGYCIMRQYAINSESEQPEDNILDYLLLHWNQGTINCFYNLSHSVACILYRLKLNEVQLNVLLESGQLSINPDYTIYYLSDKYFAVKKGNYWDAPYAQFCDIGQYINCQFNENESLDDCYDKAVDAAVIGKAVYRTLHDVVGIHDIKNMTSPVRVFEQGVLNRIDLPTVDDVPFDAGKYAYLATHGGCFETYRKGHFQQTYDYDIVAAYPYYTAQLLELRYGHWIESTQYQPEAVYGELHGKITVDNDFSPVIYNPAHLDKLVNPDDTNSMNFTPSGMWNCSISKQMYDFLYEYKRGEFEIKHAFWWIPEHKVYPLKSIIDRLFRLRQQTKGIEREVIKRVMVGLWGKLLQRKGDGFGDHFNPVWGEYVETSTKLQVVKPCLQANTVPLSITVDGVLTDVELPVQLGSDMGQWKLSHQNKALVVGTELIAIEDKQKQKDFSLDYGWLMNEISNNPQANSYTMTKLSPFTLKKSLRAHEANRLGLIEQSTRSIEIGTDRKRCYIDYPKCGQDLLDNQYDSIAWDISFLEKVAVLKVAV